MTSSLAESAADQLEQALFIDLIRAAPSDKALVITSNSWSGLLGLFGERLVKVVAGHSEEWVVAFHGRTSRRLEKPRVVRQTGEIIHDRQRAGVLSEAL